jgi:hypothetical protein
MKLLFLFFCLFTWKSYGAQSMLVSLPDMSGLMEFPENSDPEWPVELIPVAKAEYKRNQNAVFCLRPVEMVDTLVLHHSETSPETTPERINDYHLARGTPEDPWYMIAYSYVINSPYKGSNLPLPIITEGRPLGLVGAHAGTHAFVEMDEIQSKLWKEKKVLCGKENEEPQFDGKLEQAGKLKANITTIGVVITGNYAPYSTDNPSGYSRRSPRYPTRQTQDMVARLACQLQKKYPRMKYIKWHNFYHSTTCPGTIKSYIGQIKVMAKEYGCEFN